MKCNLFRYAIASMAAVLALISCEALNDGQPDPSASVVEVTMFFCCEDPVATRSSVFGDTVTKIEDLNIFVWDRGKCILHRYLDDGSTSLSHSFSTDGEYTFYVLANMGREYLPATKNWESNESIMKTLSVGRNDRTWTSFPMAGTEGPLTFIPTDQKVTISLRRLVAKLGFCFSPDNMLKGQHIKVTAVRLCNAAADVFPFVSASAATAVLPTDDSASEADLQAIAGGEPVYFYAFENCRGNLLPKNNDPWEKVPDNIGSEAALCTYLEVECTIPGDGVIGGDVTYRFYPGDDNVKNFDVKRNYSYLISLCPTEDNLDRLSWKVDANVNFTGNELATLRKDRGLHPIEKAYIGEMFSCSLININASVLAYFGGSMENLRTTSVVRCIADDGGDDLIEFGTGNISNNTLTGIEGTVMRAGTGSVWLCTKNGDMAVPLLKNVTINKPKLVFSYDTGASYPEPISEPPVAVINASPKTIHLYLCDTDGLNLMADEVEQYFFSHRPFNFAGTLDLGDYQLCLTDNVEIILERGYIFNGETDDVTGQPFSSYRYGIMLSDNKSTWDARAVSTLVDACFATSFPFCINIKELNHKLSASVDAAVSYQKIECIYLHESNKLAIYNPSNIPVQMLAYEFTHGNNLSSTFLSEFGKAYSIPSSVSSSLSSSTVTAYSAVGYNTPFLFTSPVRAITVSPASASVTVEQDRWLIRSEDTDFKGYEKMSAINAYYTTPANPYSRTGIAIDIQAEGLQDSYEMRNLGVSSKQDYPSTYEGKFLGSALFSTGKFVSSDISNHNGQEEVCTAINGQLIIYSPSRMDALLANNATLTTSLINSSASALKSTDYLTVRVENGKPTNFTFTLNLYGEVRVYPRGTSYSSNTHLIGPDKNGADANIKSGSTVPSTYYRSVPALKSVHSLSLKGNGTLYGTVVSLSSQITNNIFSQTETDSYTMLNGSNSFQHQYHPIDFCMEVEAHTQKIADIYKGTFSNRGYDGNTSAAGKKGSLFLDTYNYSNSAYLDNRNSNDSSTNWTFGCHKLTTNGIGYVCVVD